MGRQVKRTQNIIWKKIICKYSLFKECFKTIINPIDIVYVRKIPNKLFICMSIKWCLGSI